VFTIKLGLELIVRRLIRGSIIKVKCSLTKTVSVDRSDRFRNREGIFVDVFNKECKRNNLGPYIFVTGCGTTHVLDYTGSTVNSYM
jgi:hypothetical protein